MKSQFTKLITLSLWLLFIGIYTYAQGIKWTQGLNWEQVRAKAKAENKYIFVDCYATWCGPCKQMDKEVYPLDTVGEVMNNKFISVKVQMDSTKNDSENVKKSYTIARALEKTYSIVGLPAYLFFSPEGEIVHKALGFYKSNDFIQLIREVQNPEKQLYTQIKAAREGKMDVNLISAFIQHLNNGGDKEIALELARPYMKNNLESLSEAKFLTKENLWFLINYQKMLQTNDRIYELSFKKPNVVDSLLHIPGLADKLITNIIFYEIISPEFENARKYNRKPNWKNLMAQIIKKSDLNHAEKIIFNAEHSWYISINDWDRACEYVIKKFKQKDLENISKDQASLELNEVAWTLFEYSFDKSQLKQALIWINEALKLDDNNHKSDVFNMDTKANLLYKLGRKGEAIALQEKVVSLAPKSKQLKVTLEKMRNGEPTWVIGVNEKKQVK